ncbi:endolytic transglycosylase MltG [Phorcysia thermohydrogeniphila]|uniref:Endolytic murein transglycosylase n=1 Tax=Phorcysia thermohydrogeniphila TaxID=936138 RepID=A0A4R1GCV9_9BACT|nr:endolytic transglycosylase MltG [Phorcysia thermohydrogeniphila]TCK04653.1 UPF0755 protein [Phorcysia thermohydrogeniphila]
MKRFFVVSLSVLLLISLISLFAISYVDRALFSKKPVSLSLRVERGTSVKALLKELKERNVVDNPLLAYIYLRLKELKIKEGCYDLRGNLSTVEVLKELSKGRPCLKKVTIPEGSDIFDLDRILSKEGFCKSGEVLSLSEDKGFLSELQIPHLEGYVYPDTYFVNEKASCKDVIRTAVSHFKRVTGKLFSEYTPPRLVKKALGEVTEEKLLVVASIVERETNVKEEKPIIAGVIYNRLIRGMKLQCDPTVYYAYKKAGIKKKKLHRGDTSFPSPYNTYYVKGLPPTPICNPGIDSIKAAMYPEETRYLYFVAAEKGHIFSTSYNQHLKNIRKLYRDGKKVRN